MSRILILIAGAMLTAACASKEITTVQVPAQTRITGAEARPSSAPAAVPAGQGAVIGHLQMSNAKVTIHAGDPEPVYTVYGLDGRVIAEGLSLDQMRASHPDLYRDLNRAIGDSGNDARGALRIMRRDARVE